MFNSSSNNEQISFTIPLSLQVLAGCRLLLLFAIFVLNVLVVVALRRAQFFYKIRYRIIASLAMADMIIIGPYLYYDLFIMLLGLDNMGVCLVVMSVYQFSATASIYHLLLIAVDQLVSITFPIYYMTTVTVHRIKISIIFVWMLSALAASPPLFGWRLEPAPGQPTVCNFSTYWTGYFMLLQALLGFCLPAIVIIIAYTHIFAVAWRRIKCLPRPQASTMSSVTLEMVSRCGPVDGQDASASESCEYNSEALSASEMEMTVAHTNDRVDSLHFESRRAKRQMKAVKTMVIIVGAFMVCWLPTVANFVGYFLLKVVKADVWPVLGSLEFTLTSATFAILNSFLNPIIYGLRSSRVKKAYKQALWRMLLCRKY